MKRLGICFLIAALVWTGGLIADRARLRRELIRLHVVAASDSQEDQTIKLRVRDAVVESLQKAMTDIADVEQAKAYIRDNLPKIQSIANQVLTACGVEADAVVSFTKETFDTRYYDTFTLPSGVYESLRIRPSMLEAINQSAYSVLHRLFQEGSAGQHLRCHHRQAHRSGLPVRGRQLAHHHCLCFPDLLRLQRLF